MLSCISVIHCLNVRPVSINIKDAVSSSALASSSVLTGSHTFTRLLLALNPSDLLLVTTEKSELLIGKSSSSAGLLFLLDWSIFYWTLHSTYQFFSDRDKKPVFFLSLWIKSKYNTVYEYFFVKKYLFTAFAFPERIRNRIEIVHAQENSILLIFKPKTVT